MTCLWDRPINRPDQGVRLPPRSGHQAWTFLLCLSLTILASLNMGQGGETPYPLTVVPLTRNLGDPRSPGNAKLVFSFPDQLTGAASSANTEDFQVYVYPEGLDPAAGTVERYRAGGLYLWRWRQKLFLDIRDLPHQEQSGEVRIRLLYAPEGEVLATGIADGLCRYQDDAVDVVLAVDVSRSMNYNDRGKLRVAAARTFIEMASLGGGVGRVGLVTFNHRAEVKTPLIPLANGERLLSDLSKVGAEGMTSLDAPLESALSLFTAAGSENPVVVLLTDGFNEGLTFQGSYQRLAAAGIRIFAVGLSESADHALLQEMARSTNGIYFRAPAANDLQEIYARLAAELGKRYLMHAQILSDTNGELTLPIDSTVVRAVAMADGGARLGLRGPDGEAAGSGGSDGNLGSVFVAKPRPGPWRFAWQAASPGSSAFALFGDTRLFLDLFPPQLQGKTLAFGATLAQGAAPVAGRVWLEPVPGLVPERIELFDDGRHGDGREADGVYGAWEIYNRPEVNRFDVILRSAGEEAESFIRQTTGLVLRTPEPEVIEPEIEGELDFGVLFPGETGIASLATRLNGNTPGRYSFELSWPDVPIHLPGFHSLVAIDPGYQVFDIELQVPLDATPGLYHGDFNIASENGPVDRAPAQVRVGEVRFSDPGEIDLGSVPPGTTIFRSLFLPVYSDKETGVAGAVAGDPGLVLSLGSPRLSQGDSSLRLELAVTPPLGTEGEQTGSVTLRAGASSQVIPVRWLVKAYAAPTLPNMDLPAGIPEPPGELAEPPPLAFTLEPVESDLSLTGGNDSGQPDDNANPSGNEMSPWDRAVETYRDGGGDLTPPESLLERGFPTLPASLQESSDSLWNAWWLYILAALILLLLLLALLSYILYRLGKSRWLRFLLVSLMANIILLIIFIALLGTGEAPTFTRPEAINVTLTQESAEGAAGGGSFASASSGAAGGGENDLAPEESYAGGLDRPGPETFLPENLSGSLPESELAAAHLTPLTATAPVTLETSASNRPRSGRSRQAADLSPVTPNLENVSSQETLETPEPLERREQDSQVPEAAVIDAATLSEELRPEDKEWLGPVLGRETGSELAEVAPPLSSLAQPNELLAQATELLTEPAENTDIRRPRAARRDNTGPGPFPEPRAISDDPRRDQPEGARQPAPPREPGQSEDPSPEPWNESARPSFAPERPEPETIREEATLPSPDLAAAFGARRENPEIARPRRPDHSGESHEPTPNEPLSRISPTPPDTATPTGGATPSVPEFRIPAGRAELGRENLEGELRPTPEPDGTIGDQSGISLDGQLADAENTDLAGGEFEPQPRRGARRGGRPEPALSSQPGSANNLESGSIPGDGNSTPGQAAEPGERRFPGGVGSGKPGDDTGEAKGESPGVASGGEGAEDGANAGDQSSPGDGKAASGGNGAGSGDRTGNQTGEGGGKGDASGLGFPGSHRDGVLPGEDQDGANELGDWRPGLDTLREGVGGDDMGVTPGSRGDGNWNRGGGRRGRQGVILASSSLDADSLLLVFGDFSRLPDAAGENLFNALVTRSLSRVTVEERSLRPGDENLGDCLLALADEREMADWSEEGIRAVGNYLASGGHFWLDGETWEAVEASFGRLVAAGAGKMQDLPTDHQLAEAGRVLGLYVGENLAAVATAMDWRREWRYGESPASADSFRFFARSVNYFLSGDAERGIEIDNLTAEPGLLVPEAGDGIPDVVRLPQDVNERIWQSFPEGAEANWLTADWGDPLRLDTVSDGRGGDVMKLDYDAAQKGRTALYRSFPAPEDLSRAAELRLGLYYSGNSPASVSLILTTFSAGAWRDYETPPANLRQGWNQLAFLLRGGLFRPLEGGRDFDREITGTESLGRLGFLLNRRGETPGFILLDTIRVASE